MDKRSQQKELIDLGPAFYSENEYKDCLKKLFHINKLMGIFRSTRRFLRLSDKNTTLLDIGCGGGLFLLHLSRYFPQMKMLGIDINDLAIKEATNHLNDWQKKKLAQNLLFRVQHLEIALLENQFDVVLATLLCHHLSDEELILFLQQVHAKAGKLVIINDLHRHSLAYWCFAFISPWLFRNRLITHDGLISVRKGFTRTEWQQFLMKANIANYQIKWCWPFRWQIILYK